MKKLVIAGVVALSLVSGVAFAQSYYPTYTSSPTYSSGSCITITGYLTTGSRGSQVLALQQFLVSQNYPGSGTWMETGYFGAATRAALIDFQQARGLSPTGVVDSATLSALQNCNGSSYTYPGYPAYSGSTYPYNYSSPTYPYNGGYNYNNGYNYSGSVAITSLSQNSGTPGQTITIYGQGFQPTNTVYFGGQAVAGVGSNGTSISFTIPYISSYSSNQTVNLYVTNSFGTSNTLTFTLNPSGYNNCGTYPYNYGYNTCGCSSTYSYGNPYSNNCGCQTTYPYNYSNCGTCGSTYNTHPYNSGCTNNTNSPTITYLNPQSGGIGTSVTIYGSGFTTNNNTIHFGNGIITGLGSPDGQSLSFQVPSQITGYGSQPVVLGNYNVSVTNSNNITSNAVPFNVTSTNGNGNGAPTISSVSGPNNLSTGQQGTWTMTVYTNGNTYTSVSAYWGDTGNGYVNQAAPQVVYNSQTITFTHAYVNSGTYTLTFTVSNSSGQSNTYTSTVYVSGNGYNNGAPTISYLAPNSGYVGSTIVIYGPNFSTSGTNTIYLNNGAIQNVSSNGNSITFTIPSYTTPYCTPGLLCGVQPTQVTPGTYNVSVMDNLGTSNQVQLTVL
jgi:hypothetical protein